MVNIFFSNTVTAVPEAADSEAVASEPHFWDPNELDADNSRGFKGSFHTNMTLSNNLFF